MRRVCLVFPYIVKKGTGVRPLGERFYLTRYDLIFPYLTLPKIEPIIYLLGRYAALSK